MASEYTIKALQYLDKTPKTDDSIPENEKPNALYICRYLKSQGYTKAGAQAVLANVNRESSFNPAILERGVGGSSEIGGTGGYGLIQWTGQKTANGRLRRRGKLEKAANFNVTTRDSLDFQTRYLVSEVAGKAIATILKTEQNPVTATLDLLFLDIRPGSAIRVKDSFKSGQTPSADDIKRVQRRVDAIWEVQPIVDEVYGGNIQDSIDIITAESGTLTPTAQPSTTGSTQIGDAGQIQPNDPDAISEESSNLQASSGIKAIEQLKIYTKADFRETAKHLKDNLNNFVAFKIEGVEADGGSKDGEDLMQYWVPLSVILDIYNNYVSTFDGTQDATKGSNTKGRKLTEFYTGWQDKNPFERLYEKRAKYLTNEFHFSIDPMKCILPKAPKNITLYDSKGNPISWSTGASGPPGSPAQTDPFANVGQSTGGTQGLQLDTFNNISAASYSYPAGLVYKNGFHKNVASAFQQRLLRGESDDILNILISSEFVKTELDTIIEQAKDSDQNENNDMVSFMKTILKGLNEAMGSINDLDLFFDEEDDLYYVIDRKATPTSRSLLPTISLTGLRSTVSNLTIESKISSNIASMISIAAQGTGGHTKDSIGPLLEWNRGLIDRHIIHKSQKNDLDGDQAQSREDAEDERLRKWAKAYYEFWTEFNGTNLWFGATGEYQVDAISNIKGYHKTYCQKFVVEKLSKNPSDPLPVQGVIPVELSFTMMGIAGLKIGQAFLVEEGILPQNYTDNFGFIITGLSHKIANGNWTTDVKTQFFCTRKPTKEEAKAYEDKNKIETAPYSPPVDTSDTTNTANTNTSSGESSSRAGSSANITGKTITSGFPFGNTFYNREVDKSQVFIHWTAGHQRFDQAASTVRTLNEREVSYHYIIDAAGHIEQIVPESVIAWHAGCGPNGCGSTKISANTNSIGISLQNLGYCKDENGRGSTRPGTNEEKCVRLVDHNGNATSYRGYKWNQEVTDAQLTALEGLLKGIKSRNPRIPSYSWKGKETYDQFFPPNDSSGRKTFSYSKSKPGYYTHCSSNLGKVDALPTPKLVNFFKNLKL